MMTEPLWDLSLFGGAGERDDRPARVHAPREQPGPDGAAQAPQGREPARDVARDRRGAALRRHHLRGVDLRRGGARARRQPLLSAPGGADVVRGARAARVRPLRRIPDLRRAPDRPPGRRHAGRLAGERERLLLEDDPRAARGRVARLGAGSSRPPGRAPRGRWRSWRSVRPIAARSAGCAPSQPARGAARRARPGQLALAVRDRRLRILRLGRARSRASSSASSRRRRTRTSPRRSPRATGARRRCR